MSIDAKQQVAVQSESWAAVETLGYVVVMIVASVLRFWNLAAAPLTTREAAQALAAFNGTPLPTGGSPFLYALNQILFGLFGASVGDVGVRLGAAAIGTTLVLLPILWRRQIGSTGALAAAAMLAISPTMVLASRTLDGSIVVAAGALAAIGFALRLFDEPRRFDPIGLGISIGLLLTSGPGLVTLLIVIVPVLLIAYRWTATDEDRARVKQAAHVWRTVLLWGAATVAAVGTAVLLRPVTLSSVPEVVSAWLQAWSEIAVIGPGQMVQILAMYEPLIVVAGALGFVQGLRRFNGIAALLDVWFIGALLIALLQPGRQALDMTVALVPLALLGGMALEALVRELRAHGSWKAEGLLALVAVPIVAYLAIAAGSYAAGTTVIGTAQFLGLQFDAAVSLLILGLIAALVFGGIFALLIGVAATLRGALSVVLIACGLITLGNAWGVTQLRASDPHELLWGPTATAPDVRDMVAAVEAASQRRTGFPHQAPITYALPQTDAVLRWYLRRFTDVTNSIVPNVPSTVIITPTGVQPSAAETAYVGAKFPVRTSWDQHTVPADNWLRWWLYREATQPATEQETIVVWVTK